jgi:biopolymer transport protein ExbB/TolQ
MVERFTWIAMWVVLLAILVALAMVIYTLWEFRQLQREMRKLLEDLYPDPEAKP